jgi:protein SCO1/2
MSAAGGEVVPAWRRVLGSPAAWVVVVVAAFLVPFWARPRGPELPVLGEVPALALTDQAGRPFTRASLEGRVTVANFIFTSCPTICPALTGKMRGLVERMGAGPVRFVSFSVDPDNDTPAVLAAYGRKHGADFARWTFVTGPREALERAVVEGFKVGIDRTRRDAGGEPGGAEPDVWDIVHGEHFVLVDGAGRIRGYYRAEPETMDALARDAAGLARDGAR